MRHLRAAVVLAALALACAHPSARRGVEGDDREGERAPQRAEPADRGEEGFASFYAHRFHGRRTASGVRYDMHAMTCAHPTAPFGSRLRVTDLETGKSVVVQVTDRGPYAEGRVVDLSLAAAKALGMVKRGLARVRVEPVDD